MLMITKATKQTGPHVVTAPDGERTHYLGEVHMSMSQEQGPVKGTPENTGEKPNV